MSPKLLLRYFILVENRSKFDKYFKKKKNDMKLRNENVHLGYFLEVDVQYPDELHELHNDLPFLTERIKIGKVRKLEVNLYHKKYVIHIRNSKQTLSHRIVSKKCIKS